MPRQISGPRRSPRSRSRRERERDHMGVGLGPRPEVEVNTLDPLPEEDDAPLHVSPEQLGASIKEAIDAGEYSVNELVALSHLDIPGLDIEGEGAFDREALANITLAPPTDSEIRQSEHLGPGLLNFVEIPKPPEELDALLRGDIDPELYGRHVHGLGGTPEQMGVPVDDLRNQLPTRKPDGPAAVPASLTQAWDPLATPLDGVSTPHSTDPRRTTSDLAAPPNAVTRHGTNERQANMPHQGAPYPPTSGDPIADRAIQLAQGQFQQPNVLPTGQFDHAGFGQQAIRETLARLTGQSRSHLWKQAAVQQQVPFDTALQNLPQRIARNRVLPGNEPINGSQVRSSLHSFSNNGADLSYDIDEVIPDESRVLSLAPNPEEFTLIGEYEPGEIPFSIKVGAHKDDLDDRTSTVVSDGEGGLEIHIAPNTHPILEEGIRAEEEQHRQDILRNSPNLEILNDPKTKGRQVTPTLRGKDRWKAELRGKKAQLEVHKRKLKDPNLTQEERVVLEQEIWEVEHYINNYQRLIKGLPQE